MSPAILLAATLILAPSRLVLQAPEAAPPDTNLTWRAWTAGLGAQASAVLAEDLVGAEEPRSLSLRLPAESGTWIVLVEGWAGGDAWFAVAVGGDGRAPLLAVPVPEPEPAEDRDAVRLSWGLPDGVGGAAGLGGWQVLRSVAGGEPELVGSVGARATSFIDEPDELPEGEITWRLRPMLTEGVSGPLGRASEPLMRSGRDSARNR